MTVLFLTVPVIAFSSEPTTRVGVHGMVMLGNRNGLYGYHLAMFHTPHDRQVLLRIRVMDKTLDRELRASLAARPALWTLAPKPFDLERLNFSSPSPLTTFTADIVIGHFERGGQVTHKNVAFRVESVLFYRPLKPKAGLSRTLTYDVVGNGKQRFLIKRIESRPDFDDILVFQARAGANLPGQVTLNGPEAPNLIDLQATIRQLYDQRTASWQSIYRDGADFR